LSAAIDISEDARRWLARRAGAMVIRVSPRHGCCGGLAGVPVAEPGMPTDPSGYRHERLGGIDVYIDLRLDTAGALAIRLESLAGRGRLFVDGAQLDGPANG
jgi:hypothetical protein